MTSAPTITVASYNMRKAIGTDRRRRPGRVLDVINEIDADVIALQEADKRFGGRGSAVPHDLISGKSGYKPVVFGISHSRLFSASLMAIMPNGWLQLETRNIGWHGNALLVKNEVEIVDFAVLDLPMLEPRGAVLAELRIGGLELRVIGMHLDLSGLWRRRQMRSIIEQIAARRRTMPTVIMGDTNEWRVAAGCLKDLGEKYRLAPTGPSFHARRPVAALDRIIVDTDLQDRCVRVSITARPRGAHRIICRCGLGWGFSPRSSPVGGGAGSTIRCPSPRDIWRPCAAPGRTLRPSADRPECRRSRSRFPPRSICRSPT